MCCPPRPNPPVKPFPKFFVEAIAQLAEAESIFDKNKCEERGDVHLLCAIDQPGASRRRPTDAHDGHSPRRRTHKSATIGERSNHGCLQWPRLI